MVLAVVSWRALVPPRSGWLRLLSSPTSYLLTTSFAATFLAKAVVLGELRDVEGWPLWLPSLVAADGLVFLGLAALLAAGEHSGRWVFVATVPLALLVSGVALANAFHLGITGEQLSWEAFWVGLGRIEDLGSILLELFAHTSPVAGGLAIALAAVFPAALVACRSTNRRGRGVVAPALSRAHCAAFASVLCALAWAVTPSQAALSVTRLRTNAAASMYWELIVGRDSESPRDDKVWFAGYVPPILVADADVERIALRGGPNVLFVVLESARYDHTSLAGDGARARTPVLLALAGAGLHARVARAVVPHTTKSLFSMLCGRLPLMQASILEISADLEVDCIPRILGRAGYRSALFQSAWGTFEDRPRLVSNLGFEHFEAWEDIAGEPLGYLASDDASLPDALARWIDRETRSERAQNPFFAVVLTSAAHHPYRLPHRLLEGAGQEGIDEESGRYAMLMEAADRMLGELVEVLEQRGLREDTIIVVAGDHGEGFGTKGIRQHDNNYYEEGLRVPLVFAGKGVPKMEITGNASLVDVAPTLLDLLDLPLAAAAREAIPGQSLLNGPPTGPRWFGCWYAGRCQGYVEGSSKVVQLPGSGIFRFDLTGDPEETRAVPVGDQDARILELQRVLDAHRAPRRTAVLGAVTHYGAWRCLAGQPCSHPKSHDAVPDYGP